MNQSSQTASADDVRAYFERAADAFDRLYNEDGQSALMRRINRAFRSDIVGRYLKTMEHIRASGAGSVLDVGCGSGRYLAALAQMGVPRLVGIDLSRPMLDLASEQLAATGHSNVELICGNFDDLATREHFDVVIAMGFFDYQPDPVAVLSRMRQLTRHSVIASFPSRHWFRTPLRKVRYLLKRCPVFFYSPEMISDVALRAGFTDVETIKLPGAGMDYVAILREIPGGRKTRRATIEKVTVDHHLPATRPAVRSS